MKRVRRRLFAGALSLAMLFGLFPSAAFASASATETTIESTRDADVSSADAEEAPDETRSVADEATPEDGEPSDEAQSVADEATLEDGEPSDVTRNDADVFAYENEPPVFESARNYGGAATDAFHDVAYTPDGGFVVMGYSFGESADPAWTHTGSGNNNDAVLLKFDKDYKLQWSKAYGGDGVDVFNAIDVLNDGRIAAIGRSSFTSADESIKSVSWYLLVINPDDPDDYTDYRIGGTAGDQGYGVAATGDGGFVAAGWSASKAGFITYSADRENYSAPVRLWGEQDRIAPGGSDSVIVKFDAAGNVQYTVLHNYCVSENANNISSPSERLEAVAVDGDDNVYLVGYDAVAKNAQNAVIAKLNGADGSLLWHRSAGRQDQTTAPENAAEYIKAVYDGVAVLKDNSVVVTGTSTGDATTEEGWKITGVKDTIVTRYDADGNFLFSDSFGTIDDNNSRPEGIIATPDGGYIVYGSQAGVMQEDALVSKGYDWGNYGGQDAILVKYDADNALAWAENYGSNMGDWINGAAIRPNGEMIAVGESNGQNGVPAWGNNGGIDGVILSASVLPDAYAGTGAAVSDGNVTWADGSYTATGNGFGGADSVAVTVVIEGGKIASVTGESRGDSAAYYTAATETHDRIVEAQSADVDGVTGATYSSNGIKEAASKALGQSAAAYVDGLITAIADAETAKAAADAYAELGTYSVGQLKNPAALQSAAERYGVTLVSRADGGGSIAETQPQSGAGLRHNDPYYKLQNAYYKNIRAEAFEDANLNGEGVKIAVIDSGLTPFHEDLDYSRVLEGYDYDNGVVMDKDSLTDNNGHGTAVTGILAAVTDNETGVAGLFSKLQVIPLKVTPVSPSKDTDGASSKLVAQAITDAVDKYQADVITTSLDVKDTEELAQAVAYAASKGVIITGASGNSSASQNDPYIYPASYYDVISVGAVDANNKVRANSQKNDKVFVTAPGENIAVLDLSMSGRCKLASGTSYASPMVAAMAVAAKQYAPDITPARFKTLLRTSALDAGAEGYDTSYGYGIVDYAAFLDALKNAEFPTFAGGNGSTENPYLIETREQLETVSQDLTASYRLNADIDLKGEAWTPIGTFTPQGSEGEEAELPNAGNAFSGTFDGGGHTVSNLTVNKPEEYALGLFGCVSGAEIRNLTVQNATIDGCMMVGAVVGYAYNSTVSDVTLTGDNTITGHNNESLGNADMIGGVVGAGMDSVIESCAANAKIVIPDNASNAGIVGGGLEVTSVRNSSATGSVTAGDNCYGLGGVSGCGFGSEDFTNCVAENVQISAGKNARRIGGVTGYAGGYENEKYGVAVTVLTACKARDVSMTLGENHSDVGAIVGSGFSAEEYGEPYDKPTVFTLTDCEAVNVTANGEELNVALAEAYVLMNIPYADFYAAELDGGAVDAVTQATLKFENKSVAAGSYHVNDSATDEGSDLTGATYPVFVPDMSALDAKLEVTATNKKTFNLVTGREKTVAATEVEGADILFCSPSYSWFRLSEKPARYKTLTVENGAFTFGAVSGRAATVKDVTVRINYETHHGNDAEVVLTGTGIESDAVVGGVVLTDTNGIKYGLPHVQGIWSRTQLGWPNTAAVAGKTFTNVRFILRDSVIDCPVEFTVKPKMNASLTAEFTGARELTLSGLASDTANAKVTVTYTTGERPNMETHTVANGVVIVDGKVTLTEDVISGQAYTVKVESDNYGDKSASVQAPGEPGKPDEPSTPDQPGKPDEPSTPDNPGAPDKPANPSGGGGACYVATAVYGSYDCPEVWTLRRFRDNVLAETWYGRLFIRLYYAVSPTAVKLFGDAQWFQDFFRARLDTLVSELQDEGFESAPYEDTVW